MTEHPEYEDKIGREITFLVHLLRAFGRGQDKAIYCCALAISLMEHAKADGYDKEGFLRFFTESINEEWDNAEDLK